MRYPLMSDTPRKVAKMSTQKISYARATAPATATAPARQASGGQPKKKRALCRNGPSCAYGAQCKFSHDFPVAPAPAHAPALFSHLPGWFRVCTNDAQRANVIGERLYPLIKVALDEGLEDLKKHDMWCPRITAGYITGMIVELPYEESIGLLSDPKALGGKMADACEVIKKHWDETGGAAVK